MNLRSFFMQKIMREIKFRALKLRTKEFIYGSLMSDDKQGVAMIQQRANPVNYGNATGWCFGVDPESVGQFTGLQDKNGVDIYEGDVVNCIPKQLYIDSKNMHGIREVVYDVSHACFFYDEFIPMDWGGIFSYEVIGNVHTTKQ